MHWTQDPKNKKRLMVMVKASQKKRIASLRRNGTYGKGGRPKHTPEEIADFNERHNGLHNNGSDPHGEEIAAAFGYIKAKLEAVAEAANIPSTVLTFRVAKLLISSTRGKVRRT